MQIEQIDFTVGAWLLGAIFNDDFGGLDRHDVENVTDLFAQAKDASPEGFAFSHFSDTGEMDEFGLCEASGLRGPVCRLTAVYLPN